EGARLESVYTATYREFESLTHRHILRGLIYQAFFHICTKAMHLGKYTKEYTRCKHHSIEKLII
ncbi:hypothetical protein, partial [Vibrio parahaemolyticus]|uniref:hypothetical protein n=1 Tax=Vibrio parahaemolyticus TaxID=670 RepID=UPI002269FAB2